MEAIRRHEGRRGGGKLFEQAYVSQQEGLWDSWWWGSQGFPARRLLLEIRNVCWSGVVQTLYSKTKIRNSAQLSWSVFYICCAPWGLLSLTFPLEILWGFYQTVKCTSDQASRKSTFSWRLSLGMRLLYSIVLVSAVPWSESAMCVHIPPPSPRGHHRARGKLPVLSRSFPPAVFTYLFDCGFHILQRSLPWSPFHRKQAYFCLWLSDLRGYLHFSLL